MFKKISLKLKLISSFLFLAILLLVVGLTGWQSLKSVSANYGHVAKINLGNMNTLRKMIRTSQQSARAAVQVLIAKDAGEIAELEKAYSAAKTEYAAADKAYNEIDFVEGEEALYSPMNATWKEFVTETDKFFEMAKTPGVTKEQLETYLRKEVLDGINTYQPKLASLIQFQEQEGRKWSTKAEQDASFGTVLSTVMVSFGFLCSLIVGFIFATYLSKNLTNISGQIAMAANETHSAGNQLSAASQSLSSGSSEAASSLEETVASLEELSGMVKTNADHAKEANSLSQQSRESAELGEKEIARLIQSMSGIAAGSKKIEEITGVIDDIAFQTNLLALNAAVEAARAGDQGKGFAVVAEAVRNLAQRSAIAAKDIASLIGDNVQKSEDGAKIAETSATVLNAIVTNVKKVADLNQEISIASQEQASGIEQISKAMNQLDQATQTNAASSEEVAASSEEMTGQANHLNTLVHDLHTLVHGLGTDETKAAVTNKPPASVKKQKSNVTELKPQTQQKPRPVQASQSHLEDLLPMGDIDGRKVGKVEGF